MFRKNQSTVCSWLKMVINRLAYVCVLYIGFGIGIGMGMNKKKLEKPRAFQKRCTNN